LTCVSSGFSGSVEPESLHHVARHTVVPGVGKSLVGSGSGGAAAGLVAGSCQ
jgi:hypothetical protein